MTPDEILRQFQRVPDHCDFAPYKTALLAAAEQREAITPELIAAIDRVSDNPAHYLKQPDDFLHLFAIYLLAQFRETRALDSFIRFFSRPGEDALTLTGDMVTENGAAILVSVCGGDPAPLLRLAHDESANEFVRGQAINGLLLQFAWGERPREAVIADLRGLFATLPKPGDAYVWAELVMAMNDFNALELLPEARRAFADGLVDESIVGLDDIDPDAPREPGAYPHPSHEELFRWFCEHNTPVDAVAECSTWQCFLDEEAKADEWDGMDEDDDIPETIAKALFETPFFQPPPTPYIAPAKVGRNNPCPCGSGKKYKKCCGK